MSVGDVPLRPTHNRWWIMCVRSRLGNRKGKNTPVLDNEKKALYSPLLFFFPPHHFHRLPVCFGAWPRWGLYRGCMYTNKSPSWDLSSILPQCACSLYVVPRGEISGLLCVVVVWIECIKLQLEGIGVGRKVTMRVQVYVTNPLLANDLLSNGLVNRLSPPLCNEPITIMPKI